MINGVLVGQHYMYWVWTMIGMLAGTRLLVLDPGCTYTFEAVITDGMVWTAFMNSRRLIVVMFFDDMSYM